MDSAKIPKLLGVAYLVQFVASLLSGSLIDAIIGTGDMSDQLVNISNNLLLLRLGIIAELITAIGIIVMTVLLYIVLRNQDRIISLVALTFWLTEVILLLVSSIGVNALIPISLEYVQGGISDPSYFLTLGHLFYSFKEFAFAIHMLFFALGGVLWYYLFYRSEYIPRALALWGLIFIAIMPIDIFLVLLGFGLESILRLIALLPLIVYLPFEGVMGIWFIVKGLRNYNSTK
ncbi:MAG: DUF4386 domain-containing protein [Candidatus Thorarchaeota archaeon]